MPGSDISYAPKIVAGVLFNFWLIVAIYRLTMVSFKGCPTNIELCQQTLQFVLFFYKK